MINAPSKFNMFSVALGIADGKKVVVLGSTAEPPTGHHATFLDAADARIMADHLKALADHLDPLAAERIVNQLRAPLQPAHGAWQIYGNLQLALATLIEQNERIIELLGPTPETKK